MISLLRIGAAVAAATVISGTGWWAYSTIKEAGRAECRAELAEETAKRQAALDRRAAALRVREIEIEKAAQLRTALERDLADEASEDPMADDPGLGLGSLQRLNEIR